MMLLRLAALIVALGAPLAQAASSAQPLTPANTSVLGGESQSYSVRFFDAFGRPAAGERVRFANDACGFFTNGSFAIEVFADAAGVATATFTARPQGITCWITASAGVSVTFNVFTYTAGQVAIGATKNPAAPRPGQPYTLTVGAFAGSYPIYNADISARVVSGNAAIAGAGNTGQAGRIDLAVTPAASFGAYELEVAFRGVARRFVIAAPESPLQDMWWSGWGENGWGMSIVQHRDTLFSAIYAYDDAGLPTWYVMPGGSWNASRTAYSGALYRPRGTPYSSYDATRLEPGAPVGNATITFEGEHTARLAYTIDGVSAAKTISRQLFGAPVTTQPPATVGDMWWGGAAQNGWGIALLQQHSSLFGVWFTFDARGAPTWYVMPAGIWGDGGTTYRGRLYRTTGSPWLGQAYDSALLRSIDVGTFAFTFAGDTATFAYTIDAIPGTMALMRQGF